MPGSASNGIAVRIERVCAFCENHAIGACDPDAPISEPPLCKVHFRLALNGDHPRWNVLHPQGFCDQGGRCR